MGYIKKREKRWHAKEAWPTVKKREKVACQRSMTQKKGKNGHMNVQEKKGII
jgi:hypothetical protein